MSPVFFFPLQAYNIHVNGVLHCRVRYSQLLGLHEQVGLPSKHSVSLCALLCTCVALKASSMAPHPSSVTFPSSLCRSVDTSAFHSFWITSTMAENFLPPASRPPEFKMFHVNRAAFWKSLKGAVDRMEGMFSAFLSFHLPRKKYMVESAESLRLKTVFWSPPRQSGSHNCFWELLFGSQCVPRVLVYMQCCAKKGFFFFFLAQIIYSFLKILLFLSV